MVRNIPARRRSPWLSLVARMRGPPLGVRKGSLRNHPSPRHNCRHHPIDESSHRSRANRATAPDCRGRRLGPTRGEQCFLGAQQEQGWECGDRHQRTRQAHRDSPRWSADWASFDQLRRCRDLIAGGVLCKAATICSQTCGLECVLIAGSQTTAPSRLLGEIQIPAPISNELNKLLVPGTLLITTPGSLTPDNRSATSFVGVQASGDSTPSR
jgi:hypothetical protein